MKILKNKTHAKKNKLGVYEYSCGDVKNCVLVREFNCGDKAMKFLKKVAKNQNKCYFMADVGSITLDLKK